MEPVFPSRVEFRFGIKGRGVAIDPGVPYEPATHRVYIGDELEIRRPDGSAISTKVSGLEMGGNPKKKSCSIILPANVAEEEIPIGSEVWQMTRSR
ncbi:MAG: hypothetical protein HZA32_14475 [Opitutae bacterium]|nr:hypothetical protein [Opitutae bacterium]